jgi:PBP1b-binding outer membrane lipoprotein LpoB
MERKPMNDNPVAHKISSVVAILVVLSLFMAGCVQGPAEGGSAEPAPIDSAPTVEATPARVENQPVVIESGGEVPFYARFGENETFRTPRP